MNYYTNSFPQRLVLHYKTDLFLLKLRKAISSVEKLYSDPYNLYVFDNVMDPLCPLPIHTLYSNR